MALRPASILATLAWVGAAHAEISVDNFAPGEVVRYPVVTLRGHATGETIAIGREWSSARRFPVRQGQFRGPVELLPGVNMLVMQSGRTVVRFRLDYRPPTTPLRVLAVWARAADQPDPLPPATERKIDTALKLIQSFYAEAMHEAGYDRKTFALELDSRGRVIVHTVTLPRTSAEMRAMPSGDSWALVYSAVSKEFPEATTHWCTLLGFTRYDPATQTASGHYALGGGALGAFGSACLPYWPESLTDVDRAFADATVVDPAKTLDDSNGRRTVWANVATSYGAIAHEMGHTFGLPHARDPYSVMSRGFDYFNRVFAVEEPPSARGHGPVVVKAGEISRWDPFEAARLNWNPYFQPDPPPPADAASPRIEIAGDRVRIHAPAGIRVWGIDRDDSSPYFVQFKSSVGPSELELPLLELRERLTSPLSFRITVVDALGRSVTVDAPPKP